MSQSLTWLGTLGGRESEAYSVSANGRAVVGRARNADGYWRAFRWKERGGMQDLGTLGGKQSEARGVSTDGRVVVGLAENQSRIHRAFRWTADEGMVDLGPSGNFPSSATSVSANGHVVVGWVSEGLLLRHRAFCWTADGGMLDLGTLGGKQSEARGVSADGRVVVGWAENQSRSRRAFRWTADEGMIDLGTLGGAESEACGVSADGRVVVGWAQDKTQTQYPFFWTENSGMVRLPALKVFEDSFWKRLLLFSFVIAEALVLAALNWRPGNGQASAVVTTDTGFRIVGWSRDVFLRKCAFELDSRVLLGMLGPRNINEGVNFPQVGSRLLEATAVSPEGRCIVGWGYNAAAKRREAFRLLESLDFDMESFRQMIHFLNKRRSEN